MLYNIMMIDNVIIGRYLKKFVENLVLFYFIYAVLIIIPNIYTSYQIFI